MKTTNEVVAGNIDVWAVPTSVWEQEELGMGVFKYRLKGDCDRCWDDGAVKVHTQEIVVTVPDGIDLRERAVATLTEEQERIERECKERVANLEKQIRALLCLEAPHEETK